VFGGPEAERRLVGLLADARPEVRFNAATGLARHGDSRSEEVLLEMLQPNAPKDEAQSERPSGDDVPRRTVQLNALRAARVVLQAQRAGHPARLVEAVQRLAQAAADPSVRSLAREVMAEQSPRSDR
jgi:HEAT repeat protein